MEEVLSRRLSKINKDENTPVPNVIIIDGGRGQFNSVHKILKKHKLDYIDLLSISKGPERNSGREIIHLENRNLNLRPNDALLYFIQRLRDEAHRFAIEFHRQKRSKSISHSVFKDIKGIGTKKAQKLLVEYKSTKKIASLSIEEVQNKLNVSDLTAKEIIDKAKIIAN